MKKDENEKTSHCLLNIDKMYVAKEEIHQNPYTHELNTAISNI